MGTWCFKVTDPLQNLEGPEICDLLPLRLRVKKFSNLLPLRVETIDMISSQSEIY